MVLESPENNVIVF